MKTLALEMSTARGSIALREERAALFDSKFAADRKHSGAFFENVELCVERFGPPGEIIVGLGPGSYAGVRIAISTALGLGAATKAKLAGIASICALEVDVVDYGVIGDARRQSFFFARVENGQLVEGPTLHSVTELAGKLQKLTLPIYASEQLAQFPVAKLAYPCAARLAEVARLHARNIDEALEPIYLREPHITVARATPPFAPRK